MIAALSVRYAQKRFAGFSDVVRKAPYLSGLIIFLIGLYLTFAE